MCGMCGIYSHSVLTGDERDLFKTLMIANVLRGEDATGVIKYTEDSESYWHKTLDPSPVAMYDEEFHDFVFNTKDKSPTLLMGHTRWGTIGKNIIENAHPFVTDKYLGMMNGTVWEQFEGSEQYGTDSEGLYNTATTKGLIPTLEHINEECWDPQYALQMLDMEDWKFKFIRNNQRPLWFTVIANGQTLVWSSTLPTLKWAIMQHKQHAMREQWVTENAEHLIFDQFNKASDPYFQLKPDVLLEFTLDKHVRNAEFSKHPMPSYDYSGYVHGGKGQSAGNFTGRTQPVTGIGFTNTNNTGLKTLLKGQGDKEVAKQILRTLRENRSASDDNQQQKKNGKPSHQKNGHDTGTTSSHSSTESADLITTKPETKGLFQNYRGFGNKVYRKKHVLAAMEKGCSTCNVSYPNDEYEIANAKWIAPYLFSCTSCQSKWTEDELKVFAEA